MGNPDGEDQWERGESAALTGRRYVETGLVPEGVVIAWAEP